MTIVIESDYIDLPERASAAATPGSNVQRMWMEADGLHVIDDSGNEYIAAMIDKAQTWSGAQTFNNIPLAVANVYSHENLDTSYSPIGYGCRAFMNKSAQSVTGVDNDTDLVQFSYTGLFTAYTRLGIHLVLGASDGSGLRSWMETYFILLYHDASSNCRLSVQRRDYYEWGGSIFGSLLEGTYSSTEAALKYRNSSVRHRHIQVSCAFTCFPILGTDVWSMKRL